MAERVLARAEVTLGLNSSDVPRVSLKKLLDGRDAPFVVDVGCNVGDFSAAIFAIRPRARVVAVDMQSELEEGLCNRFAGSEFSFLAHALADHPMKVTIDRRHVADRTARLEAAGGTNIETTTTLDQLAEEHEWPECVDLLKVDCEGWDLRVLRGGSRLLSAGRIRQVIFEIEPGTARNGHLPSDYISFMRKMGFTEFWRSTKWLGFVPLYRIRDYHLHTQNVLAWRED